MISCRCCSFHFCHLKHKTSLSIIWSLGEIFCFVFAVKHLKDYCFSVLVHRVQGFHKTMILRAEVHWVVFVLHIFTYCLVFFCCIFHSTDSRHTFLFFFLFVLGLPPKGTPVQVKIWKMKQNFNLSEPSTIISLPDVMYRGRNWSHEWVVLAAEHATTEESWCEHMAKGKREQRWKPFCSN